MPVAPYREEEGSQRHGEQDVPGWADHLALGVGNGEGEDEPTEGDQQGDLDAAAALRDGRVTRVNLPALGPGRVRGLAFDPRSQHLFVLNPRSQVLYELTESGQVVTARDLAAIGMKLVRQPRSG